MSKVIDFINSEIHRLSDEVDAHYNYTDWEECKIYYMLKGKLRAYEEIKQKLEENSHGKENQN